MSYTVLARRYRSKTFDDLVGQEHIARTLIKAIESGRIAHAYLFCGTRGTGKTSSARILAKCLNCEKFDKPTGKPCGQCNSCGAIARGEDMDVIEIDAASNTQVDKTREIIDNAQYRPARSRFKIYIIDEVHMLSKASFNALLKTLEEPPEHVKFILATTEAEKVLPTILSRCQRYDFRNIPTREIADHLKAICKEEEIKVEEDALLLVAKAGAGSMRDALSLLDRLLSVGEKELTVEMIEQLLGLPRAQLVFNLAQVIGEADTKKVLEQADNMIAGGLAPDSLIASLVDHMRNLLILRICGPDSTLVEVPGLAMKDLQSQAERFDPVVLTQDIAILEELRRQLRSTQAGRALLDAALVRLALAEQFNQIGNLLSHGNGAARSAPAQKKKPDEPVRAKDEGGRMKDEDQLHPTSLILHPSDEDDSLPAVGKVWEADDGPSLSELLKQRVESAPVQPETAPQPPTESNTEAVDPKDLTAVWQTLLTRLQSCGTMFNSIFSQGRLTDINDQFAVIHFDHKHETFVKRFEQNGKNATVRDALEQVTGKPIGVKFELGASETAAAVMDAPVARPVVRRETKRVVNEIPQPTAPAPNLVKITQELTETLRESEPLIKQLMNDLDAKIVKVELPDSPA